MTKKKNIKRIKKRKFCKEKVNWKLLLICLIIVFGVGAIGSIFTTGETNSAWYNSVRPAITPPGYVFPIVWNILFLLIALSLYYSWTLADKKEKKKIAWVFGINFVLNIFWSIFYFKMHNPVASFIDIIFLWISIAGMIYVSFRISKKAAWLLIPYLLWVSFASLLNYLSIG